MEFAFARWPVETPGVRAATSMYRLPVPELMCVLSTPVQVVMLVL